MRTAGLAAIFLLAGSGSVLGYPQYPNQDSTDGSDGGSVSGEFWWQQGGAFGGDSGTDATNALSNIFNQVVNAFNSTVAQVTSQVTSGNSITPTQSEYCALGQGCVPWQLCPDGVITQGSYVEPGKIPYPSDAGFTGCSDVKGNICCGIPGDVLDQQQQGQSNVFDTCSAGLQCVAIESCNLYNGFIEPQVEQYAGQPYVNYNKCTGSGTGESVCCQAKPSGQQTDGSGVYSTDGGSSSSSQTQGTDPYNNGDSSSDLNAQCASNQDCVPYFQCYNGEINTDGAGLLDVRTKPKATCSHPEYPDVPAICCRIPGAPEPVVSSTYAPITPSVAPIRESQCDGYKVCVSQGLCDASGNIITDGGGLIDIRIVHKRCNVDGTSEVGVCCLPPGAPTETTPRPIPQIDACPSQSICTEPSLCLGEAMDSSSSWTAYSPTGAIFSQCSVGGGSYNGVCCINPIPQIDACPSQSVCTEPSLCLGEAMDSSSSWTAYSPTGAIFSQCSVGGGSYNGVCCINPIPQIDACPSQSACIEPSLCLGEAMDATSSWTAYSPTGTIFSQCSIGSGSYNGVCCINPIPQVEICPRDAPCMDPSLCNGEALDSTSSWIKYSPTGSIFSQCTVGSGSYTGPGVCCINPIPQIDACPSQSACIDPSLCKGEAMDSTSSWTAYSPTGTIFSQCSVGGGSYNGVCCINPIPQIDACPSQSACIDPNLCKGEAMDATSSWTAYSPTGTIFSQCSVGGGSYNGVCCINPIPQIDACPSQSSCIDPSLCKGDAMDATSSWTAYSPTGTIFSQCTVGSGSYTGPGVCCINPAPIIADTCPDYDECVPKSQCDQNGNIVTDGSGLIDIRRKTIACYVDEAKYESGICCTPPQTGPVINAVDTCPGTSSCVPELLCSGRALNNDGSMVNYITGGVWSTCNLADDYNTPGICCEIAPTEIKEIKPCAGGKVCVDQIQCGKDGTVVTDGSGIFDVRAKLQACYTDEAAYTEGVCCNPPPPSNPLVDTCPGTSTCVPDFLCTGEILDSTGSMIPYAPQGSWSQCPIGGSGTVMGVCCINPPPLPPVQPIIAAPQCGRRNLEEVLDQRIQSNVATNEAQFGEFPWQAIIFFTNYTFKCGASLIGDRWLVTGGHCVNGLRPDEIQIRLGEWQVNSFDEPLGYVDVPVKGITVHPDFNPKNVQNNVAVVELAEPVEIQYHINSICLPAPGQTFPNQRCIISGWGKDSFEGNYQHIIKKVDVPTVDKKTCQALLRKTRLGKWFFLHNSFMCAGGEENKDACKGDGGGPLACEDPATGQYYLAGLTSWGIGCGNKDVPGVYADVQGFSSWIQGVIGGTLEQQQQVVAAEVETGGSNPYGK